MRQPSTRRRFGYSCCWPNSAPLTIDLLKPLLSLTTENCEDYSALRQVAERGNSGNAYTALSDSSYAGLVISNEPESRECSSHRLHHPRVRCLHEASPRVGCRRYLYDERRVELSRDALEEARKLGSLVPDRRVAGRHRRPRVRRHLGLLYLNTSTGLPDTVRRVSK